jgi:hypothetical protein
MKGCLSNAILIRIGDKPLKPVIPTSNKRQKKAKDWDHCVHQFVAELATLASDTVYRRKSLSFWLICFVVAFRPFSHR